MRLRAGADTLPARAREAFERAAEKSAVVLAHHGESSYADDALLLMGKSFFQLGRHADSKATFRRLVENFPESRLVPEAQLGIVKSERLLGDHAAARAMLAVLVETAGGRLDSAELLYERGLIELGTGEYKASVATLQRLLRDHPAFARRNEVALRFADAELAAGEYDAAIDAYAAYRDETSDPAQRRRVSLKVARAMAAAGRDQDAIDAFGHLLDDSISDSLAAVVLVERGELHAAAGRPREAEADFRRVAQLVPGTAAASRATLGRARIEWRQRGDRDTAIETLLDAFLHAPLSSWGDSARTEARGLERILHYQRIAEGREVTAGLGDAALVRSTALYRMAEEILEVERDPLAAAAIFDRLSEQYPASPWAPSALLARGMLSLEGGREGEGEATLRRLVELHPDHRAADSARRALGIPVPDRPAAFYAETPLLASLAGALPRAEDPMIRIVDHLDRYAPRAAPRPAARARTTATPGGQAGVGPPTEEPEAVGPPVIPGRPEP